jgi:uncharacterized membrane protein YbjE (DUF340 family)
MNMWIILLFLLAGTFLGYYFARLKGFNKVADKASLYIIYVLLFFMGLSIGSKPEVMKNLAGIGIEALLIAIFAIAGSTVSAYFLYRFIFRRNEE